MMRISGDANDLDFEFFKFFDIIAKSKQLRWAHIGEIERIEYQDCIILSQLFRADLL